MLKVILIDGDEQVVKAETVASVSRRTIRSLWTGNSYQVRVLRIERCSGDLTHDEHLVNRVGHPMHWCPGGPAPMTRAEMTEWLVKRGVESWTPVIDELLDRYAGKTEEEMDAIYDEQHGPIA